MIDILHRGAASRAFVATLALAVAAPFELRRPLVTLPWQSISNLEAVLLLALAVFVAALTPAVVRRLAAAPLALPWTAMLLVFGVSAMVAPVARVNALHMVARLGMAFAVYVLVGAGAATRARAQAIVVGVLGAGVVAAALTTLEYAGVRPVMAGLLAFRAGPAVVGGQLRAAGPLQYPTIASMYLEIVFALGLGLLIALVDRRHRRAAAATFAALALVAEAIVLTFTRAGLISMGASMAIAAVLVWRTRGRGAVFNAVAALGALVAAVVLSSHSAESMRLRMTTEGQDDWYAAQIAAPATLALPTDGTVRVPITLTNTGGITWDSTADPPIRFSYHWLLSDSDRVVAFEGARTAFPEPVGPREKVSIVAAVRAPQVPGRYRLVWDLAQEGRLWFSTEPDAVMTITDATVSGAAVGAIDRDALPPMPRPRQRPGRLVLWRAAARLLATRPLLGIGLDNFRLLYGRYAGLPGADPRVHTNNMYFELLVGGGLVGALAFGWLLWRARAMFAAALRADAPRPAIAIGLVAAGVAILLHGLVDCFLSFTPTYVLFGLTAGLAGACARGTEHADANRV